MDKYLLWPPPTWHLLASISRREFATHLPWSLSRHGSRRSQNRFWTSWSPDLRVHGRLSLASQTSSSDIFDRWVELAPQDEPATPGVVYAHVPLRVCESSLASSLGFAGTLPTLLATLPSCCLKRMPCTVARARLQNNDIRDSLCEVS